MLKIKITHGDAVLTGFETINFGGILLPVRKVKIHFNIRKGLRKSLMEIQTISIGGGPIAFHDHKRGYGC